MSSLFPLRARVAVSVVFILCGIAALTGFWSYFEHLRLPLIANPFKSRTGACCHFRLWLLAQSHSHYLERAFALRILDSLSVDITDSISFFLFVDNSPSPFLSLFLLNFLLLFLFLLFFLLLLLPLLLLLFPFIFYSSYLPSPSSPFFSIFNSLIPLCVCILFHVCFS